MEKKAFEKMYEMFYMRVFSYVMTLTKKQDAAEEITQATFYKAFTAKSAFRGEANEMTWLCAIAKNLFFDEIHRQSKNMQIFPDGDPQDDSGINIECEIEDRDATYRIHLALNELGEPYRKVFELRVFGELSFREIGTICKKTESWARVTYHRARLKLQERMSVDETGL